MGVVCAGAISAHADIITVTNTQDSGSGSLRQALRTANDGDMIIFAVTGTIVLTSGGLPVNKSLTISGPGKDQLSIDGNQALLVFGIFPDKTATISDLTIRNGETGILNDHGTLTVSNCAVSGNVEEGGAVQAHGDHGIDRQRIATLVGTHTGSIIIMAKQASIIASLAAINTAASSTMACQAAQMTRFLGVS